MANNRRLPRRRVIVEDAPALDKPQEEPELIIHHDDDDQPPPLNVPAIQACSSSKRFSCCSGRGRRNCQSVNNSAAA